MSEKELKRKTWIDKTIDRLITQRGVAEFLGISERQVRRLISRYREKSDIGLVSGSRGKPGNRRLKEKIAFNPFMKTASANGLIVGFLNNYPSIVGLFF